LTYVLGKIAPSGKKAEMGTIFHKVMECLASCKKGIQEGYYSIEDDALGNINFDEDVLYDKDFYIHLFNKSFDFYTDEEKSIHDYCTGDKNKIYEWIENTLTGQFDPRRLIVVDAEPHFDFEIKEEWAKYKYERHDGTTIEGFLQLKGTIDLITEVVKERAYETIDWKTGECRDWGTGKQKGYKDFLIDPQLRIYYLALRRKYENIKEIAMTMNYVRTEGPFTVAYTDQDIEKTKLMLKKRFDEIRRTKIPAMKSRSCNHWFCKRVCWFGKDNIDGKCTCQYIADKIKQEGIDKTIAEETEPGFTIGYYQNPGS